METLAQADDKTLAKAHSQYAVTQTKKGVHKLQKGMTRFVKHNPWSVGVVSVGGVALLTLARLAQRHNARTRRLPRYASKWAFVRAPLRKAKAIQSRHTRVEVSPRIALGALIGASALIGTGLTMLLAPRLFMRFTK